MSILDIMRPKVDETYERLIRTQFKIDPIAGRDFSQIPSIIGSAQKRHGNILESAIRTALNQHDNYEVWTMDNFKVSSDAVGIVAGVNNIKQNPDWLPILENSLAYGNESKILQIDLIAYNRDTKEIKALEIKRGYSSHDAGKKKAILKDVLCVQMLLKSYGTHEGFDIESADSKVCNFYKVKEFLPQVMIDKDDLDSYFDVEILSDIEEVNHYFRGKIQNYMKELAVAAAE